MDNFKFISDIPQLIRDFTSLITEPSRFQSDERYTIRFELEMMCDSITKASENIFDWVHKSRKLKKYTWESSREVDSIISEIYRPFIYGKITYLIDELDTKMSKRRMVLNMERIRSLRWILQHIDDIDYVFLTDLGREMHHSLFILRDVGNNTDYQKRLDSIEEKTRDMRNSIFTEYKKIKL